VLLRWSCSSCARVLLALALFSSSALPAAAQQERTADLVHQGDALFGEERYREALATYEKARAQDPSDVDILMRVAKSREKLWDPDSEEPANRKLLETAAGEYKEALGKDPDDQEALDGYCRASVWVDRTDAVYAFLKDRAAKRPRDARTIAWLAEVCPRVGRTEELESWIRRWISVAPNDPEPHAMLGSLAWDRSYNSPGDQMQTAVRHKVLRDGMSELDRAIALEPNYFAAMSFKSLLFHEQAKVEPDPSKKAALKAKADEWKKKAYEARQRPMTREIKPLIPVLPPPRPKKPGA
jgi:tetratricopeptide (TPR) repeat protein